MDLNSPRFWLLALPLAVVIALIAGAFILQAACALSNIEDLGYLKAFVLILLLIVCNAPIGVAIYLASEYLSSPEGWSKNTVLGTALALGCLLSMLVSGLVLFWPLHVTYGKAVLVAIMHNIISLVVGGVLGGLILVGLALLQLCMGP